MGLPHYLDGTGSKKRKNNRKKSQLLSDSQVAVIESLEPRLMLAAAPIGVDTFNDVVDAYDGLTSLREALVLAEQNTGDDIINLPAGTYGLDYNLGGLLINDASGRVTITCDDQAAVATIDGNGETRVFKISTGSVVEMDNLQIIHGQASDFGGGIYNHGQLLISDSTISNNSADSGGGIVSDGTLMIVGSTISNNTAYSEATPGGGGGVFVLAGSAEILNSTITNNSTTYGSGGGVLSEGNVTITNCTIVENNADSGQGGGVAMQSTASLYLDNTIIAANTAYWGANLSSSGSILESRLGGSPTNSFIGTDEGHSIVDGTNGNMVGTADYPIYPMLGYLADNGGLTQTHLPQSGSPVIDAGNDLAATSAGLTFDQRGMDYPRQTPPMIEIGAVEVLSNVPTEAPVNFNDSNLEQAIRDKIGNGQGGSFTGDLTPSVLAAITGLNATSQGVSDLTGLEYCTGLSYLGLGDNDISDISPLAGLTNLIWLDLAGNWISDVVDLAGLSNLTNLSLHWNQVSDVSPLAGLTGLINLSLMANDISNISPLSGLTQVQWMDLSGNQISDLSPLSGLTGLRNVHLDDNEIIDISPLANLTGLEWIAIWDNQIIDISPLLDMTGLMEVQVWDNPLGPAARTTIIPALEARGVEVTASAYYEVWGTDVDHGYDTNSWITGDRPADDCVLLGTSDNANDAVDFDGQYDYYVIVTRAQVEVDSIQGSTGDYNSSFYTSSNWDTYYMTGEPDSQFATLGMEAQWGAYASVNVLQNPGDWQGLTLYTGEINPAMHIGIAHSVDYDSLAEPFWYDFEMWIYDYGQATSMEFQAPDGLWRSLWLDYEDDENEWEFWQDDFYSTDEIAEAFPQGFYSVRAETSFGQVETTFYFGDSETQTPLAWPTQMPEITNIEHGQVDVPVDTVFQWLEITDPNSSGVYVEIEDVDESEIFQQYFGGDDISTTETGPADLLPGQNYEFDIENENTNWQTTAEGFGVHSGLSVGNTVVFRTAGGSGGDVLPDLELIDFTYPAGPDNVYEPGDSFDFIIDFGNIGEGNAIAFDPVTGQPVPHNFLEARLSTDMIWGNDDDIIISQIPDTYWLGGSEHYYDSTEGTPPREGLPTLPAGTPDGVYYVAVMLDADNQIPESNETNNILWSETADLFVGGLNAEPASIIGRVWNDVTADGVQNVAEPSLAGWGVYLDNDESGDYTAGDTLTTTGAYGAYSFTDLEAGTYYVGVIPQAGWVQTYPIDPTSYTRLVEPGEISTHADFGMYNMDLTVQMPTTHFTCVAGKEISGTVNVRNLGQNYTNGSFDVTLHQRSDTNFDPLTDIIDTVSISRLISGGSVVPVTFTITAPTTQGTYYLNVMADNGDCLLESDETNNWGQVITLTVVNPTHVLSVGVRNNPVSFAGDIAAGLMNTAFSYSNAVTTNELLKLNTDDAENRTTLINAINEMKNTVSSGDTFVLYIASQAYAFETGDETPVECHYNSVYPYWDECKEFSGDEYLYLSTANGSPSDYLTDDDLADLFMDAGWQDVNLVFILDTPYSGGFFGESGGEDSGDLSQLGNVELLAAAKETDFAWMLINDKTGLGINTFGADLATTLVQFKNETTLPFDEIFVQTNHPESVYRNGVSAMYLADGPGTVGANTATALVGRDESTWVNFTDADGSAVWVSMAGGQSRLTFNGENIETLTIGSVTYITGDNISLNRIDVIYSNALANLTVKVLGGDGKTEIDTISGLNPLGSLRASQVTLTGTLEMLGDGYVGYIQLGDITNGADITMLGNGAAAGVTVIAGQVGADSDFDSASPIRYMRTTDWESGFITAPWIGSISTTGDTRADAAGDFGATINTASDGYRGYGLYSAYIAGEITGGAWNIAAGNVGAVITRGGTEASWTLTVSAGWIGTIRSYGNLAGQIFANGQTGWIGKVYAAGNLGQADEYFKIITEGQNARGIGITSITGKFVVGSDVMIETAGGIVAINIAGWEGSAGVNQLTAAWIMSLVSYSDFNATVTTTGEFGGYGIRKAMVYGDISGSKWQVMEGNLSTLRVAGLVDTTDILVAGNIDKIITGAVKDSGFFAGIKEAAFNSSDLLNLADDVNKGDEGKTIRAFYALGLAGVEYAFTHSTIAAEHIGKAYLKNIDFDDNVTDFGVSANTIGSFYSVSAHGTWRWASRYNTESIQDYFMKFHVNKLDDFVSQHAYSGGAELDGFVSPEDYLLVLDHFGSTANGNYYAGILSICDNSYLDEETFRIMVAQLLNESSGNYYAGLVNSSGGGFFNPGLVPSTGPSSDHIYGDANGDGVVSAEDYISVQANFGATGSSSDHIYGDANGDGVVSADDYASIQEILNSQEQ